MIPQQTKDKGKGRLAAFAFTGPQLAALHLATNDYRLELIDRLRQLNCPDTKAEVKARIEALDSFYEKAQANKESKLQEHAFIVTGKEATALHLAAGHALYEIDQQLEAAHHLDQAEISALKWQRRGLETFLEKLEETEWKTAAEW